MRNMDNLNFGERNIIKINEIKTFMFDSEYQCCRYYLFFLIIYSNLLLRKVYISMGTWRPRIIITVIVMGIDFVQWEVSECTLWQLLRIFLKRKILPFSYLLIPLFWTMREKTK